MKTRLQCLALVLVATLGSCSWSTAFLVLNATAQAVRLEYTAPYSGAFPTPMLIFPAPALLARADLERGSFRLDSLPEGRVTAITGGPLIEYSLSLPPDSAILVFEVAMYDGGLDQLKRDFDSLRVTLDVDTLSEARTYKGGEI